MLRRHFTHLTILYLIGLSTFMMPGTDGKWGKLFLKPLSFGKPTVDANLHSHRLELRLWFHRSHRKSGHTIAARMDPTVVYKDVQNVEILNTEKFTSRLKLKFTIRCAYVDPETDMTSGYSKEKQGTLNTKPQNFTVGFPGGCKWRFIVNTICDANWYGISCDKTCAISRATIVGCDPLGNKNCVKGWKGKECNEDVDECHKHADLCKNGGTCVNQIGSYSCLCPNNFVGQNCISDVNECHNATICNSRPHSYCVNTFGSYKCVCVNGTILDTITKQCVDFDECKSNPCLFGGKCVNIFTGFYCKCKKGFGGKFCGVINECIRFTPCENNGQCRKTDYSFECVCPAGFFGTRCESRKKKKEKETGTLKISLYIFGLLFAIIFFSTCIIYLRDTAQEIEDDHKEKGREKTTIFTGLSDLFRRQLITYDEEAIHVNTNS